jgi:hypothetical protein
VKDALGLHLDEALAHALAVAEIDAVEPELRLDPAKALE